MKGLNLLFLTGIDDTEFKLVDEPTFRWVLNGGTIPEHTIATHMEVNPGFTKEKLIEEIFTFTGSSPENDRALVAVEIYINNKPMSFYSVKDFLSALKEHNIVINEVYEGKIY